jgi:hypothetical protein
MESKEEIKNRRLIGVASLTRHGARTPVRLDESNSDFFNTNWRLGSGVLTDKGKCQLFMHGQSQLKYKDLIGPDFSEVMFLSTHFERTIQSMHFKLKGIYNPTDDNYESALSSSLNKNFTPESLLCDYSINFNKELYPDIHILKEFWIFPYLPEFCSNIDQALFNKVDIKKEEIMKEKIEYFFQNICPKLQKHVNNNMTCKPDKHIDILIKYFDTLVCHHTEELDLSKLQITDDDISLVEKMISFYFLNIFSGSSEKVRVAVLPLMTYLSNYFEELQIGNNKLKYIAISFHDTNLSFLLAFLRNIHPIEELNPVITFASELTFEVYEVTSLSKVTTSHSIQILFNGKKYIDMNLDKFLSEVKKLLYTENEKEEICNKKLD